MNRVVIADITSLKKENHSFGHFFKVAKMYTQLFSGIEVIVSGGPIYKEYFENLYMLKYDVDIDSFTKLKGKIISKFKEVKNCIDILSHFHNETIVFQDYSNTSLLFGIFLKKSTNQIYLIQYKCEIEKSINKILFRLIKKRISGILCSKKENGEKYKLPYLVLPDYIYTNEKVAFSLKENLYDYGIFGIIREGKDVVNVAKKFIGLDKTLIIAGSCQSFAMQTELEFIAKENKNVVFCNKYLTEEEYDALMRSAKVVILPYTDDYYNNSSSGVILDVLFLGKPVITKKYEIFNFVEQYNLGFLYESLDDVNLNDCFNDVNYLNILDNIKRYIEINRASKDALHLFLNNGEPYV